MLAIGGIETSAAALRAPRRGGQEPCGAPPTESRALIAVQATTPTERVGVPNRRPLAAFLAQLIATQTQAPQTRARRRAEPEVAAALYSAATALRQPVRGRFRRDA